MKGLENLNSAQVTTMTPQTLSTMDYVNVNQQRGRPVAPMGSWQVSSPALAQRMGLATNQAELGTFRPQVNKLYQPVQAQQTGVKLICDIDQVFPVPEVSIYKLAKLDGSHPEKLAKLDTRIDRDSLTGLYHVQVSSILDDDELQMKYGLSEPVYFECLIALTNLELSKYADNKRSIIYRPGECLATGPINEFWALVMLTYLFEFIIIIQKLRSSHK